MTEVKYNETVLKHFQNPCNVGKIEKPDGYGEHISDVCGDEICIYLKIANNIITDIKFLSLGCAASIASGSVLTEMVKEKTVIEAEKITTDDIVKFLGGLPEPKIHCSVLAADALHKALKDYRHHVQ